MTLEEKIIEAFYKEKQFLFSEEDKDKIVSICATLIEKAKQKEIVICAAVRASDGIIVRGHRHCDAIRTLQGITHYLLERPHGKNQGFITSKNRYVDKKEGLKIQLKAGITSTDKHRNFEYMSDELYSEDLY